MNISEKERQRRVKARCVCLQAWRYMRNTVVDNLALAMRIAWLRVTSRLVVHRSKIRGVTYGKRQKLLKRLSCYREEEIKLIACREYDNPYDRHAIEIYASVNGKGTACLG